jgi:sugar phosphate isomerase/epimerase
MRDFSADTSALSLNTATLGHNLDSFGAGWPVERVIDACAKHGFGGITFWRREIGDRAIEIGNRVRATGMEVTGLCRTPYLVGSELPANWLDEAKASIDMTADLGATVLTIVSGGTEPGTKGVLESQKILAERLSHIAGYAAAQNVQLALEPLNPMFGGNRTCIMSVRDALNVCNMVGAENVGIAVDIYHVWWDSDFASSCADAGSKIIGFHLCDWLENTRDMLLDRGMMGDGIADLRSMRGSVEAAGFKGFCEVEVFSKENWWKQDPEVVLIAVADSFKKFC